MVIGRLLSTRVSFPDTCSAHIKPGRRATANCARVFLFRTGHNDSGQAPLRHIGFSAPRCPHKVGQNATLRGVDEMPRPHSALNHWRSCSSREINAIGQANVSAARLAIASKAAVRGVDSLEGADGIEPQALILGDGIGHPALPFRDNGKYQIQMLNKICGTLIERSGSLQPFPARLCHRSLSIPTSTDP